MGQTMSNRAKRNLTRAKYEYEQKRKKAKRTGVKIDDLPKKRQTPKPLKKGK